MEENVSCSRKWLETRCRLRVQATSNCARLCTARSGKRVPRLVARRSALAACCLGRSGDDAWTWKANLCNCICACGLTEAAGAQALSSSAHQLLFALLCSCFAEMRWAAPRYEWHGTLQAPHTGETCGGCLRDGLGGCASAMLLRRAQRLRQN